MPDLGVYGVARTRAFRALWIAKELGLDYEHIPIEIGPAGARKAEYLRSIPTVACRRSTTAVSSLWESLAITLYLAKKHGRLYPPTLEGEAKAWQWSLWSVQEVDRGVNIVVRVPCGFRPRTVTRSASLKRSRCWSRRSRCSRPRWPDAPTC